MLEPVFHYQVPGRGSSHRPGAHAGRTTGTGNEFKSHARLMDCPDPRRIDLRASLRSRDDDWLVRVYRQRAAVPLHAVVDVSASMAVGQPRRKLDVAAAFVAAMGDSAFKMGDPAGLCAFDSGPREDLYLPARHSRGAGQAMASLVLQPQVLRGRVQGCGLVPALRPLAGRQALVFLVSDFHWPLHELEAGLDLLERAWVVPLVVWDASEIAPPAATGFVRMRDAEGGSVRPVWVNAQLRERWATNIAARRQALDTLFAQRQLRPLYLTGGCDNHVLSKYFLEPMA